MSAAPELRILDGLHAGARAPLQGAGTLRLGRALDNDIVLADAGLGDHAALLRWDAAAQRWQLLPVEQPAGEAPANEPFAHALGDVVRLGPLRLSLSDAEAPWPEAAQANEAAEPTPEPEAQSQPEPVPTPTAEAPSEPAPQQPPTRAAMPLALRVLLAGSALLALGLVAALIWLASGLQSTTPAPQPATASTAPPLQDPGLRWVSGSPPRVEGLLADDAALEALNARAARWPQRPQLRVWTPSLLLAALRDGGELFPALQLDRGPEARLQLRGSLQDEAQRAPLKARLAALLPAGWPIDDSALLGPAQLGEAFIARARAAGFALSGSATPGQPPQLRLQGRIEPEQLARWEQWLVAENHRLAGSLRFTVALQPAPPLAPMSLREPRLPFALRAVIGGPEPQLLLVDGRRLLPGGELDGLRLLAIEPEQLRFERLRTREVFSLPR